MAEMSLSDALQLTLIIRAIDKGKFREAARLAQHQDTAARDNVPESVWNKLDPFMG